MASSLKSQVSSERTRCWWGVLFWGIWGMLGMRIGERHRRTRWLNNESRFSGISTGNSWGRVWLFGTNNALCNYLGVQFLWMGFIPRVLIIVLATIHRNSKRPIFIMQPQYLQSLAWSIFILTHWTTHLLPMRSFKVVKPEANCLCSRLHPKRHRAASKKRESVCFPKSFHDLKTGRILCVRYGVFWLFQIWWFRLFFKTWEPNGFSFFHWSFI